MTKKPKITYREFIFNNTTFVIKLEPKKSGIKQPTIIYKNTGEQVGDEKGLMRRLGLSVVKTSNHNTQAYIMELYRILEENNIVNITENVNLVKFEKEELIVND